jgi:murein DD-endopeptidase MepM/ murein hydrolase activator NlpD
MKTILPGQTDLEQLKLAGRTEELTRTFMQKGSGRKDAEAAREAAREFESFLLYYLIKTMRETVQESELLGKRNSEHIYRSMLDEQIAHRLAERGGFGLGEMIYRGITPESAPETQATLANPVSLHRQTPEAYFKAAVPDDSELSLEISARISSGFGWRNDPFTGESRMHKGIDLALPAGTPVRAAADGTVLFSGEMRGYGKVVILGHGDGTETVYAHNRSNRYPEGTEVRKGEMIARAGMSGRATGPHLHFEVRKNGEAVNPSGYVNLVAAEAT